MTTRASLGCWVCPWIEEFLVHAEGDYIGQPFRLRPWQKRIIWRIYEIDEEGRRVYDRVLLGLPKGNGKTELAAALALAELDGPVEFAGWDESGKPKARRRTSPDIPVAAASYDQADTLFGAAKTMIEEGELKGLFETYQREIYPKHRSGSLYRVAAEAGTNDGARPSCFVADELHEWEGRKARVHLVLSNNCAKRTGAWQLAISTAGRDDPSLLLHKLYSRGRRSENGTEPDPRFLFIWREASKDWNLDDREELRRAILEANPAAGDFLDLDAIVRKYDEIPEHEFRRYYLNQWESGPEKWCSPDDWSECEDDREIEPGTPITMGFDGSYARDSTALVGCTLDGHLFVLGCWERPPGTKGWRVDMAAVDSRIRECFATYDVRLLGMDPFFWRKEIEVYEREGFPVVEWPSHTPSRMAPACKQLYDSVIDGSITHDGDERLAKHVANSNVKEDRFGRRIVKDHKDSDRHIDLAVAAVIAYDVAVRQREEPKRVWRVV